jgi:hypothetical protein
VPLRHVVLTSFKDVSYIWSKQGNVYGLAILTFLYVQDVQGMVFCYVQQAAEGGKKRPLCISKNRGADKSLARPGRKQATTTEDFGVRISYL